MIPRTIVPLFAVLAALPAMAQTSRDAARGAPPSPGDPTPFNIVWDSPGPDHDASMPLGNGEVGINAWWEPGGDLVLYISRTDAWEDNARLAKLGRVRFHLDPPPSGEFRQELVLRDATIEARHGDARWRVWVDANHPTVIVEVEGGAPRSLTATVELWRSGLDPLGTPEIGDPAFDPDAPDKSALDVIVGPDTRLSAASGLIGWFHHNARSVGYPETMALQDLEGFAQRDPILHRTFGAAIIGGDRAGDTGARSAPALGHAMQVATLTLHPASPDEWTAAMRRLAADLAASPLAPRRGAHQAWWRGFWDRSWLIIRDREGAPPPSLTTPSTHPIRIGVDQHGANRFVGEIGRAAVFGFADDQVIAALAASRDPNVLPTPPAAQGNGPGLLAGTEGLDHSGSFTCEAWIRPGELPPGGGRIIDKTTPGGSDGFLFDTYPGCSLRLMTAARTIIARDCLPIDGWVHVAAACDAGVGELRLFVNNRLVASERIDRTPEAEAITRGYILQRFITASAGRGAYPIKFNGSIFTVPREDRPGGPDYRRWGAGYWWQNTRLPYAPLCLSGDYDLLKPLFKMYAGEHLAMARYRTQRYWGHAGAYLNECAYFWGAAFNESYGWVPRASGRRETEFNLSRWHRWEFQSGLELCWMMLDYADHTGDRPFTRDTLIPFSRDILEFYSAHYETDAEGTILIEPSQALETWWECTNPAPELAGLRAVCTRLLGLPDTPPADREAWSALLASLPPLPTMPAEGGERLAPAVKFAAKSNEEHPELYAVFPYREFAIGRPRLDLAIRTYLTRDNRANAGWHQDDIFAAYLGLTEEARAGLAHRASRWDTSQRFPGFWGPNYDWTPDQCHGGVLMTAAQAMVMQCDGRAIHLLPAWPEDWDADFRLHAPLSTIVQGRVRAGHLVSLEVQPPERAADVTVHGR